MKETNYLGKFYDGFIEYFKNLRIDYGETSIKMQSKGRLETDLELEKTRVNMKMDPVGYRNTLGI